MSKVILITGSNTGIGLDIARLLAQKKHIVYISSRKESAGEEALNAAVSTISAVEGRLDILMNNAAISNLTEDQNADSIAVETICQVMETNVYGVIRTTIAFLPLLKKSDDAEILNVSSRLGSNIYQSQQDNHHYAAYNTSKAALNSYTIGLAHALQKDGVKVNAVTPGLTSTRLNGYTIGQSIREGVEDLLAAVLLQRMDQPESFMGPREWNLLGR